MTADPARVRRQPVGFGELLNLLWAPALAGLGTGALSATLIHGRTMPTSVSFAWSLTALAGTLGIWAIYAFLGAAISFVARSPLAIAYRAAGRPLLPLLLFWPFLVAVYASDSFNHRVVNEVGPAWLWGFPLASALFWAILAVAWSADGPGPRFSALWHPAGSALGPLILQFVAFRIPLLFLLTPHAFFEGATDYGAYEQRARLGDQGLLPYLDYWLEYPPLFPWLAALARLISEGIGGGYEHFDITLGALLLVFETGNLILIYLIARRVHGEPAAIRVALIYSVLFYPLFAWRRSFDCMAIFFALAGLYLAVCGRRHTAAAALAFGFMTKVFPAVFLLPLLRSGPEFKRSWRVTLTFAGAVLALGLPLLAASPRFFIASFQGMLQRPPWESLWALALGYFSFGWVHRYRLDPGTATEFAQGVPLPAAASILLTVLLALVFTYMLLRTPAPAGPAVQVWLAAAALLAFAIYLKGWSPQFMSWILPLVLLCYPSARGFLIASALTVLALLENPGYFVLWSDHPAVLWAIVGLRTAAFAAIGIFLFRRVIRARASPAAPPATAP